MHSSLTVRRLVAVVAAIGLAGVSVAVTSLHTSPARSQAPTPGAGPDASHSFALFAKAQSAADRAAASKIDAEFWRRRFPQLGVITTQGVRVVRATPDQIIAAVPTDSGGCLLSVGAGQKSGGCTRPDEPSVVSTTYGFAMGLVPNTVRSVTLHFTDGRSAEQPVVDNIWTSPSQEADAVDYTIEGRRRHIELMPMSSLPKNATLAPDGSVAVTPAR